jgi:hypothetical protein
MNNDTIIGTFIGVMLSTIIIYLLSGFICGVFCNNNRNNIDDNNRDNDNNTTNALDSTIVNNPRIYCVPTNITRKTSNIITIVVINDNEVDDNDSMDNLPIAKLVVN